MKWHIVLALLLSGIAVLYQIECNTARWKVTESAKIGTNPGQLSRFITNADMVDKWFSWVSHFKEADSRPISQGKKYQAIYRIPFFGDYIMLFRLVEYKVNKNFVLESDSFLKPKLSVNLRSTDDKSTTLDLSLEFRRTSALYHFTVGPLMWFLSGQQLRHSLFVMKMMFPF